MILFLLKKAFGNEKGHVHILYPYSLKPSVQLLLDILPDSIACGLYDHAALHTGIIAQLGFLYHIRVPLREVHIH